MITTADKDPIYRRTTLLAPLTGRESAELLMMLHRAWANATPLGAIRSDMAALLLDASRQIDAAAR